MQLTDFLQNNIVQIVIVIIAALIVQRVVRTFIAQFIRRAIRSDKFSSAAEEIKREDTVIEILGTTFSVVLWIVIVIWILGILGVNLAGLLTGAGLIGVVVGFGAQNTIKDFIAGTFILIENQYRVGDIVTLSGGTTGTGISGAGTSGVVEDINLRITKLRDLDGTLHIVRNGEASVISNRTFNHSSVVVDITVTYESNIDEVEQAMNAVGLELAGDEKWKSITVEPIQFLRIDRFVDSGAVARALGKVAPAAQWDMAGAYRRRLLQEFKNRQLTVALPHIVIQNKAISDGATSRQGRPGNKSS